MDIQGLDFIKKSDEDAQEEMRVTGLDFNIKKEEEPSPAEVTGLDFIVNKEGEPTRNTEGSGVTGLDSIKHTKISSGDHEVAGLDCIKKESKDAAAEVEGLDSIRQRDFSDFGIKRYD